MRRLFLLSVLAFASCATPDASGDSDLLIVRIANTVPFDRVDYHFAAHAMTPLDITDFHISPLRSDAQWEEWREVGQGWTDVTVEAFNNGAVIATGAIHGASYTDEGNGLHLADLMLQLTPTP